MKKLILYIVIGLAFYSCQHETDLNTDTFRISNINIAGQGFTSRAAIWNTILPSGSQIGLSIFKTESGDPLYTNVKWTLAENTWNTSNPLFLNSENHTAYIYHPYMTAGEDIESMAVTYNQSDYMYGVSTSTSISSIAGHNAATFILYRAMTRVAVFIRKEPTYKGNGQLTYLCLRNAPNKQVIPTDASLLRWNAKTGKIHYTQLPEKGSTLKMYSEDSDIVYPVTLPSTIGTSSIGDVIFAPVDSFNDGDAEIYMIIDGQEYVVPIPSPKGLNFPEANGGWKSGYNYRYALSLTPKHLTLSAITINDWVEITDSITSTH